MACAGCKDGAWAGLATDSIATRGVAHLGAGGWSGFSSARPGRALGVPGWGGPIAYSSQEPTDEGPWGWGGGWNTWILDPAHPIDGCLLAAGDGGEALEDCRNSCKEQGKYSKGVALDTSSCVWVCKCGEDLPPEPEDPWV